MDGATRGSPGRSRAGALVLLLGGVLFVGMNVGLAPLLPMEADFAGVASSPVFLWRQSIASIATLLLLGGSVALHARQAARSGAFGKLAFAASMLATRVLPRLGPALLIAGFFGVALLGAALPGIWGMVAGTVVLGAGWIALGAALFRDPGPGA